MTKKKNKNEYPIPLLLDLSQVLELTGFTEEKLFQIIEAGSFPNHERYGQIPFWSSEEVRCWIAENRRE